MIQQSLNCKNVYQVQLAYRSSDEEFYHVFNCQLLLSKGVAGGGAVGALKNSVNVTN